MNNTVGDFDYHKKCIKSSFYIFFFPFFLKYLVKEKKNSNKKNDYFNFKF